MQTKIESILILIVRIGYLAFVPLAFFGVPLWVIGGTGILLFVLSMFTWVNTLVQVNRELTQSMSVASTLHNIAKSTDPKTTGGFIEDLLPPGPPDQPDKPAE